jgi:hypothetical protein
MYKPSVMCLRSVGIAIVAVVFAVAPEKSIAQTCIAPPSGMVAWFPGDGVTNDLVTGTNGIASSGVGYAAGMVGEAFHFDGVTGVVNFPQSPSLNVGAALTIEFWMRADTDNPITSFQGLVVTEYYGMEIGQGFVPGGIGAEFFVSTNGSDYHHSTDGSSGSPIITPGVWYHYAGVFDGSALVLYENGVVVRTALHAGAIAPMSPDGFLSIGGSEGWIARHPSEAFARYFKGLIDEVTIFNRALSPSEVQDIYGAGAAGRCKPGSASLTAAIRPPINADGSSVFNVNRGVVPVKFTLAENGVDTCELPPATISVSRTAGGVRGAINESEFIHPSDDGSSFRVSGCQYIYNLNSRSLGTGTYAVDISIGGVVVGTGAFSLR